MSSPEYCTVLYCTVLYCTVLYCTVLYSTVLYCTVLYLVRGQRSLGPAGVSVQVEGDGVGALTEELDHLLQPDKY